MAGGKGGGLGSNYHYIYGILGLSFYELTDSFTVFV